MKRTFRSILGVTLLEIMLVLAIAAMIIVMSVRYYQTASTSNEVNTVLQQIQGITAASDSLAQSNGSYTTVTNANLQPLLPTNSLNAPWGAPYTVTGTASTVSISVTSTPATVCSLLGSKLTANTAYSAGYACAGGGTLQVYYVPGG